MVETVDADDGIGESLDPIRRQLEIIVRVDSLQPGRNILVTQRRLDASDKAGQRLLRIFAGIMLPLLAVRCDVVDNLESRPVGLARVNPASSRSFFSPAPLPSGTL